MNRTGIVLLALSLALAGCDFPLLGFKHSGGDQLGLNGGDQAGGKTGEETLALDAPERQALAEAFRDFLAQQQARQQVNVTSGSLIADKALIADNSAGLLSNNGASFTKNAPLISNNASTLLSNNGSTYRVAAVVTREGTPLYVPMANGQHFYRFANAEGTLLETFVTRVPSTVQTGFSVPEADVLVHSTMTVTLPDSTNGGDWNSIPGMLDGGTTHYAISVQKSPVLQGFKSDVRITTLSLAGPTHLYVENASYKLGGVPVTAASTHSAFASFPVDGKTMDLPTSGQERIAIGDSLMDLSYQNVAGKGVGTGTWKGRNGEARPLTYVFDFGRNLAELTVQLPSEKTMLLTVKPGLQIETGRVVDAAQKTLANLVKRADGSAVLRFVDGKEQLLFE